MESLFSKVADLKVCNVIKKETPSRLFSCEYHKNFLEQLFFGTPPVTASENCWRISKKCNFGGICTYIEWNNVSEELWKIESTVQFKLKIISFIRPTEISIFMIQDTNSINLMNCLRLNFSHLNEHKFRNKFRATIEPMYSCGLEPETTLHQLHLVLQSVPWP